MSDRVIRRLSSQSFQPYDSRVDGLKFETDVWWFVLFLYVFYLSSQNS